MINIVMVLRDRYRLTCQSLDSLRQHTKEPYTLTLVDDCSMDYRVQKRIGQEIEQPLTTAINIIKSDNVIARAKNLGVYWSEQTFGQGDYLYLSDNDVYFKPSWDTVMLNMIETTEPDGYRLWGGQAHPFHQRIGMHCTYPDCGIEEHQILDGPSWMMLWRTWDSFGPFRRDTAPGTCQSEEYPFIQGMRDCKWRIGVPSKDCVLHTGLTNTKGDKTPGYEERKALMEPGVIYE